PAIWSRPNAPDHLPGRARPNASDSDRGLARRPAVGPRSETSDAAARSAQNRAKPCRRHSDRLVFAFESVTHPLPQGVLTTRSSVPPPPRRRERRTEVL